MSPTKSILLALTVGTIVFFMLTTKDIQWQTRLDECKQVGDSI